MTTIREALEPCPYCGALSSVEEHDKWAMVRNIAHFVRCPECHSRTGNWGSREAAIAAWNHRVTLSPSPIGEEKPPHAPVVKESLTTQFLAESPDPVLHSHGVDDGRWFDSRAEHMDRLTVIDEFIAAKKVQSP